MKKTTHKNHIKRFHRLPKDYDEKTADSMELNEEIPQDYRDTTSPELGGNIHSHTSMNASQPQDRSEDLINETDPFIQQPERDAQLPSEMVQARAYRLYEQRGGNPGDD